MFSICVMCTPEAAGGGGPIDLPAAILAADRRALDHAVFGEILARDEAAGVLHALDEEVAQRPAVQRLFALLGDQGQRLGIVALHQPLARP